MTTSPQPNKDQEFVEQLCEWAEQEDRAVLAALRRGLGKPPGTVPTMFPYVEPLAPPPPAGDAYYLIASLFAWHPSNTSQGDLGTTFARIRQQRIGETTAEESSLERRFVALLNAHQEDLPYHLRQAVSLAKSEEVPINWVKLLEAVKQWDHEDRYIQRRWARSFWGQAAAAAEQQNSPSEISSSEEQEPFE